MNTNLSDRQLQVLDGIAKGHTNRQIANLLKLSEKTVKAHVTALFRALRVTNRTEAALKVKADEHCPTCTCTHPANAP